MVNVVLYVEGGGDRRDLRLRCQEGFRRLIEKAVPSGHRPRIVACGTRRRAFDRFAAGFEHRADAVCLLLVDSETPILGGQRVWPFLAERDGWRCPPGADEEHVHLMVQCMEAWLVTDPAALERFYDGGFAAAKLPQRQDIEAVSREDIQRGLDAATRNTKTKGRYDKGSHSFALLGQIDPQAVSERSPFAARFFDALSRHCAG